MTQSLYIHLTIINMEEFSPFHTKNINKTRILLFTFIVIVFKYKNSFHDWAPFPLFCRRVNQFGT